MFAPGNYKKLRVLPQVTTKNSGCLSRLLFQKTSKRYLGCGLHLAIDKDTINDDEETREGGFGSLEGRQGTVLSNILHLSPRSRNLPSQLQWKKILLMNTKPFFVITTFC